MSQSQGTTMITAAAAAGVLVAAGIAAVGSDEPTAAAPKSAPPVSSVAPYATPNTLYRPIVLTASGWSSQGVPGSEGFVVSGGSGGHQCRDLRSRGLCTIARLFAIPPEVGRLQPAHRVGRRCSGPRSPRQA